MKCILCEKNLEPIMEITPDGEVCLQPYGATMWDTYGNYGSTAFDSIYHTEMLLIHICDECLLKHAKKMYAFKGDDQVPVAEVLGS